MKKDMELSRIGHSSWFKHWFDTSFYHQLYAHRDEREAAAFINELVEYFQPVPGARMLDLGCGAGRHARQLASKGFAVTGIDLASSSIQTARKIIQTGLAFYKHDMRDPFGSSLFDHIFSFFTSFGYFSDTRENNRVVNNIANALKPGGTLMMDYINVRYSEDRLVAKEQKEIDGIFYHLTRWSDEHHFYKKIVIERLSQGSPLEYLEKIAKLRLHDFDLLFRANSLVLQEVFGDYQLSPYNLESSPRLILIAQKI